MAEGGNGEAPAACASRRFCRGGSLAKAGLGTPKPKTRLCTAFPATGAGRAQTGEGRGGGVRTDGRWSGAGRKRGRGVRARHKGEETRDARVCAALKSRAREAFASGKLRTRRSWEGVTRAPPFLPPPPPPAGRAPPPRPGRCQVSPAQRPGPRQRLLLARGSGLSQETDLKDPGRHATPCHATPRRPPRSLPSRLARAASESSRERRSRRGLAMSPRRLHCAVGHPVCRGGRGPSPGLAPLPASPSLAATENVSRCFECSSGGKIIPK